MHISHLKSIKTLSGNFRSACDLNFSKLFLLHFLDILNMTNNDNVQCIHVCEMCMTRFKTLQFSYKPSHYIFYKVPRLVTEAKCIFT